MGEISKYWVDMDYEGGEGGDQREGRHTDC